MLSIKNKVNTVYSRLLVGHPDRALTFQLFEVTWLSPLDLLNSGKNSLRRNSIRRSPPARPNLGKITLSYWNLSYREIQKTKIFTDRAQLHSLKNLVHFTLFFLHKLHKINHSISSIIEGIFMHFG